MAALEADAERRFRQRVFEDFLALDAARPCGQREGAAAVRRLVEVALDQAVSRGFSSQQHLALFVWCAWHRGLWFISDHPLLRQAFAEHAGDTAVLAKYLRLAAG